MPSRERESTIWGMKKYWLRGGLIGVVVLVLLIVVLIPFGPKDPNCQPNSQMAHECGFYARRQYWTIPTFPGEVLVVGIEEITRYDLTRTIYPPDFIFYSAIVYFLIGSLVGYVYGRKKTT